MLIGKFETFEEFIQWYNRKLKMALKFEKLNRYNMFYRTDCQRQQNLEQELNCMSYENIEKLKRVSR